MSTHQSKVMNSFEAACKRLSKLARGADGCCCNHLCNSPHPPLRLACCGTRMVTFRYSTEVQLHFERTHLPLGCTFTLLSDGNVPGGRHSEGVPDLVGSPVGTGTREFTVTHTPNNAFRSTPECVNYSFLFDTIN